MKEGYSNLETNQLELQEIHPLRHSYINHDIWSTLAFFDLPVSRYGSASVTQFTS